MHLAPIALFAFKRPYHFKKCLDSLVNCPLFRDSRLYIFIDGPRGPHDVEGVARVLDLAERIEHPDKHIVARSTNMGLARSISSEVTKIVDRYGTVIVIEDDLVLHPSSLAWFNAGLEAYRDLPEVMQVGAYQYSIPEFEGRDYGTFQNFITTWGWATWKRAWDAYDPQTIGWQQVLADKDELARFNMDGNYPYDTMLRKLHRGEIDSWGIRWYYSVFKKGGLSLMPPMTLVQNEGFDADATHNSLGNLKNLVSGRRPAMWTGEGRPKLPLGTSVVPAERSAFHRGLRRTNALRNDRIKKVLSKLGFSSFR